jgi:hypothetical protein
MYLVQISMFSCTQENDKHIILINNQDGLGK